MKKVFIIALSALLCFAAGCASGESNGGAGDAPEQEAVPDPANPEPAQEPTPEPTPEPVPDIITGSIEMEDGGLITFELYKDIAPQSVRNFVYLARQGYYDGLRFHRIMNGFMIQAGCPFSRDFEGGTPGTGNPGYSIIGEFDANGFENNLSHDRGVMSMARSQVYDSAGSQFFICHGDPHFLDGEYAAFGRVTGGMDVVDQIADTPILDSRSGRVAEDNMPVIKSITINGNFEFPEPDKLGR